MRWAPVFFVPAPLRALPFGSKFVAPPRAIPFLPFADLRLTPHYPAKSPLDDVLRLVAPGSDEFVTEQYAFETRQLRPGSARLQLFSTLRWKRLSSRQVKKAACVPAAASR